MRNLPMNSEDFLEELLRCASPSGQEDEARFLLKRYLSPCAERFYTDILGSSYAVLNEKAPFRVLITGHQDEVAAQIVRIDEQGFLYCRNSGFPAWQRLAGCMMEVITRRGEHIPAVVLNRETEHLTDQSFQAGKMYLDIGAADRASAEKLVSVGDYIVSAPNFRRLADGRIVSKALDDKLGVYLAAETFRRLAEHPPRGIGICFVGASQEELGSRGARSAAYALNPAVAIAVDVSHATDFPGADRNRPEFVLGKGIGIYRNANNTPALLERMLAVAERKKIDFQLTPHYAAVSSTDASVFQITRGGMACALLGIPNRYMHSQVEMADLHDVESGIELLTETIRTFRPSDSFLPPLEKQKNTRSLSK